MSDNNHLEEWVRESMQRFEAHLTELTKTVTDVRDRLITMEARSLHGTVETQATEIKLLNARLVVLEAQSVAKKESDKVVGKFADWAYKLAPWIFATALVVINYYKP